MRTRLAALALFAALSNTANAGARCREVTNAEWSALSVVWKGREAVAFASWCSSCKDKILAAIDREREFVLISVFDEPSDSERVLTKLGVRSECVYGDGLAKALGINALPWSKAL
jgi:hypothetical protein